MGERHRIYPVTGWELWAICILGWWAVPLVLLIRNETRFHEDTRP